MFLKMPTVKLGHRVVQVTLLMDQKMKFSFKCPDFQSLKKGEVKDICTDRVGSEDNGPLLIIYL